MPEEQQYIGKRWTEHTIELFKKLGWTQRGDANIDIPCTTCNPRQKGGHGIDLFFTYHDPYQNCEIGIIVENKDWGWSSINKSTIQDWIEKLIKTVHCAPYSPEFTEKLNFTESKVNTGLLLIWAHDGFDHEKFLGYLKEINIPRKKLNPVRISILNNEQILRLYSIADTLEKIEQDIVGSGKFSIYYPSYKDSDPYKKENFLTLEYIHSKFIFGKLVKNKEYPTGMVIPENITVVFYFDKLNLDGLNFLYAALRRFQLVESKIWIYIHEDPKKSRSQIKEFIRDHSDKDNIKIEFKTMKQFKDIPWEVNING